MVVIFCNICPSFCHCYTAATSVALLHLSLLYYISICWQTMADIIMTMKFPTRSQKADGTYQSLSKLIEKLTRYQSDRQKMRKTFYCRMNFHVCAKVVKQIKKLKRFGCSMSTIGVIDNIRSRI